MTATVQRPPEISVANVVGLFSARVRDGESVDVLGYNTKGDGGGITPYWDASSSDTINGVTVFPGKGGTLSFDANGDFDGAAEGSGRFIVPPSSEINVKAAGMTGDGVTSDVVAFIRAVNASIATGRELVAPTGEYVIAGHTFSGLSGRLRIRGVGEPKFATDSAGGISFTADSTSHTLAAHVQRGDEQVQLTDASAITVGEILTLSSTVIVGTTWNRPHRHTSIVVAKSGNTVTISEPCRLRFLTTDAGVAATSYREFAPHLENLHLRPSSNRAMTLTGCLNSVVRDCTSIDTARAKSYGGFLIENCYNAYVEGNEFDGLLYGLLPKASSAVSVVNTRSNHCRHPVSPQFFCSGVYIDGVWGENNTAIMDSHDSFDVHYSRVYTNSDRSVSNVRSIGGSVRDSRIRSSGLDSPTGQAPFNSEAGSLESPYGTGEAEDLYAEADFVIENLKWAATPKVEIASGRNIRIKNSDFRESDGVTVAPISVGPSSAWDVKNVTVENCTYDQATSFARYGMRRTNGDARTSLFGFPERQTTDEFDGGLVGSGITPTAGGSGYTDATGVSVTGGAGSGATVDITTDAGAVTAVTLNAVGTGYESGDVLTITGGNADATITVTLAMLVHSGYLVRPGFQGIVDDEYAKFSGLLATKITTGGDAVIGLKLSSSTQSLSNAGKNENIFAKLKLLVGISHANAGIAELKEYHFHGRISLTDNFWFTPAFTSADTGQANTTLAVDLVKSVRVDASPGKDKYQHLFFRLSSGRSSPSYCASYEIEEISQAP